MVAYRLVRKRRTKQAGLALRLKMQKAGWSQADVARLAKCSVSMVDKVVHGEKKSDRIERIINNLKPGDVPPRVKNGAA